MKLPLRTKHVSDTAPKGSMRDLALETQKQEKMATY